MTKMKLPSSSRSAEAEIRPWLRYATLVVIIASVLALLYSAYGSP